MGRQALVTRAGPGPGVPAATPVGASPDSPGSAPVDLRRQLTTFGFDLAAPIAIYCLLHGLGVSNLVALGAGALVPASGVSYQLVTRRRTDGVGVVVVATVAATIVLSVVTGEPRFVLARDGLTTGLWGIWFVASVANRRPAAFVLGRPFMEGRRLFGTRSWDEAWEADAAFRRIWRVASVIWGAGMLADGAARVVMSYVLPVDVVPSLGAALSAATFVVVQIVTNTYYNLAGLYRILGAPWVRPRHAERRRHVEPDNPGTERVLHQ